MYTTQMLQVTFGLLLIIPIGLLAPQEPLLALLYLPALTPAPYLAFTTKLPARLVRWSISTRAYTDGFNRNYPTTRMWNIPAPLFRFLVKREWSVKVGLLLPAEFATKTQLPYGVADAEHE